MRHQKSGRKLKRTSSHKRALLRNLATALFEHKKIATTEAKAKELRPYAEKLITKAKTALKREKQGLLPEGQKIDIHNRRIVSGYLSSKAVLQELFDAIAPVVEERPGGYTRIVKTGIRRGDAGRTAIIELVDWSAPQDGAVSTKKKRKPAKGKAQAEPVKAAKAAPAKKKSTKAEKEVAAPAEPADELTNAAVNEPEVIAPEVAAEEVQEEIQIQAEESAIAPEEVADADLPAEEAKDTEGEEKA